MTDFLLVMTYLSAPFIGVGILLLLWSYSAYKLQYRYPAFYGYSAKVYDNLPKLGFVIVILIAIYFFFTEPSYYDY